MVSVGFKEALNTVLDRDKFLIRAWTYNPNTSLVFMLSIPVAVYLTKQQIIVLQWLKKMFLSCV